MLEFFWYGCIHCYNLEPAVEKWEKTLPKDVQFRRVPAVFNERWALDAAIFYTFEAMGVLDKVHRPFFDAIHKERLRSDKGLRGVAQKQGVDTKFNATMKSFGVQSKTRRAAQPTAPQDQRCPRWRCMAAIPSARSRAARRRHVRDGELPGRPCASDKPSTLYG